MEQYGLIGEKLGHSYSKMIHEASGEYSYGLFSLSKEEFGAFLTERKFKGLNITIPYKKAVIPYCDRISPLAEEIGAVNTVYWKDGELWGTNTDYYGFLYAARQAGISFDGKHVLIMGNGGTSLTARKAAADQGAASVLIASRRQEPGCISYEDLAGHPEIEIIVNTTPVGTYPNNGQQIIDLKQFPSCCGVIDVIYNPFATALLQQAKALGISHSNGLPMLAAQATAAAEHFLDRKDFQEKNEEIIRMLRRDIENIVLIGMPGCGKSTLGKLIAAELGKTFVDLDAEIEKDAGCTIPEIFAQQGEGRFRELEHRAAVKAGKERSQIIATGGGVVLKPENMAALSQNGRVIFVKRPLEKLATAGRPLSKDANALKSMYETRFPLYNKYNDMVFETVEGIEKNKAALLSLIRK